MASEGDIPLRPFIEALRIPVPVVDRMRNQTRCQRIANTAHRQHTGGRPLGLTRFH